MAERLMLPLRALVSVAILGLTLSLHAAFPLGPREIGPTAYAAAAPETAFAGSRFFTVWAEELPENRIRGAISDAGGRTLSPQSFPIPNGGGYSLTSMGQRFALFLSWGGRIQRLVEIDTEGRTVVEHALNLEGRVIASASNGTTFLVLMSRFDEQRSWLDAVLLDRAGRVVRQVTVARTFLPNADLVAAGDGYVVVTASDAGVVAHLIALESPDLREVILHHPSSPDTGTLVTASRNQTSGDIAIAWSVHSNLQMYEHYAALLSSDGDVRESHRIGNGAFVITDVLATNDRLVLAEVVSYPPAIRFASLALGDTTWTPTTTAEVPGGWGVGAAVAGNTMLVAMDADVGIRSVLVDRNGAILRTDVVSRSPARQLVPYVSAGDGYRIAAWTEMRGQTPSVHAVVIGPDGQPGTPHVVQDNARLLSGAIASNGSGHLAITASNEMVYAVPIDVDSGAAGDPIPIRAESTTEVVAVTWADGRWVLAAGRWTTIEIATLNGRELGPWSNIPVVTSPPEDWSRSLRSVALAFDGRDLLLAWSEHIEPPCYITCPTYPGGVLVAARISTDATLLDAPFLASHWGGISVSLATSGSEFLLVADGDDGISATMLRVSNDQLRAETLPSPFHFPARAAVTWDGTAYAVALRYETTSPRVALKRYGRDGQPIGPTLGRTVGRSIFDPPVAVVALSPGEVGVAIQEESGEGGRATLYVESDLDPLPPPPSPPRNVRSEFGGGTIMTSWDPPSTGDVEMYLVEMWPERETDLVSEAEHYTALLPPEARQYEHLSRMIRVTAVGPGGVSEAVEDVIGRVRRSVRH